MPSGNPPISSLTDPFTSLGSGSHFVTQSLTANDVATASGGVLTLAPAPANGKAGIFVRSATPWRLDESQVSVNMTQVVSAAGHVNCKFLVAAPGNLWNEQVGFWYESGWLYLFAVTGGIETDYATVPYSATSHAWLRIRESGTAFYWETSSDGTSWTTLATAPDSVAKIPLDGVTLDFDAREFGTSGNATPGMATFTGLNAR